MNTHALTLLMPALHPSDSVRHCPVALLLAGGGRQPTQIRVDARLARARCVAKAYVESGSACYVGAKD